MINTDFEGYTPLFELGLFENKDPAVRVVDEFVVCPTTLAALVTALFETVMRTVPDKKQIEFEQKFLNSLDILMRERINYDITVKFSEEE